MKRLFPVIALGFALLAAPASPQSAPSETIAIDASDVARGIIHAKLSIPARPGPMTLVYPKWIPGEHSPAGPITELVGLRMNAGGIKLGWKRDLIDMYAFHVVVPPGATTIDASLDYLLAAGTIGSKERHTTARLAMLNMYAFTLYPHGTKNTELTVVPSIELPHGWEFATALIETKRDGQSVAFAPVTLETFLDSPLLTGENFRKVPLDTTSGTAELDIAGEVPEDIAASDGVIRKFKHLIREADAEYGARHWKNYHFLLALTDAIDFNGIEHHESSDDRAPEAYLIDPDLLDLDGDLLPHEFTHSWNGKYRRPYDLQVDNYQDPEQTDLLWVYEGLTQYLGDVLAERSGLRAPDQFPQVLAASYADLDATTGRLTRPLADTADAAQLLYTSTPQFRHDRRSVDYYAESELMWLEADAIIRRVSGGTRSIDGFVRAFYGPPASGPKVVTYTRADVIAALNRVAPYDWAGFFGTRIDSIADHPPAAGFAADGWRFAYTAEPTSYMRETEKYNKQVVALYSIGATVSEAGDIVDVRAGSPADKAGLAPFQKVLAVGGRRFSADALHDVIRATASGTTTIPFVVDAFGAVSTLDVVYGGGEKYPRLVPIAGAPDVLGSIVKPRGDYRDR